MSCPANAIEIPDSSDSSDDEGLKPPPASSPENAIEIPDSSDDEEPKSRCVIAAPKPKTNRRARSPPRRRRRRRRRFRPVRRPRHPRPRGGRPSTRTTHVASARERRRRRRSPAFCPGTGKGQATSAWTRLMRRAASSRGCPQGKSAAARTARPSPSLALQALRRSFQRCGGAPSRSARTASARTCTSAYGGV